MIHFVSPADAARWLGLVAGAIGLLFCRVVQLSEARQRESEDGNGRGDLPRGLLGFTAASFVVSMIGQVIT